MERVPQFKLTKPRVAVDDIVINRNITSNSIFVSGFPFNTPYDTIEDKFAPERVVDLYDIIKRKDTVHAHGGIILYMANGKMGSLTDWNLSESERKWCNSHGMHFCFYEPLCLYDVNEPDFNMGFYSEFDGVSNNKSDIRAWELDSVKQWAIENGLTAVHCHTGDWDISKQIPHYTEWMRTHCNDIFLGEHSVYHTNEFELKRDFSKHFISTTWRYTSARHHVCAWLAGNPRDNLMTWYYDCSQNFDDRDNPILNHPDLAYNRKNFLKLDIGAPWYLDLPATQATQLSEATGHHYPLHLGDELYNTGHNPVHENPIHYVLRDYYRDCFCDIVCESRFAQPTGNISEKVFQSIQYATPYIMVAPQNSLGYMRDLGFQSFSDWWPEDYDCIADNGKRLARVLEVCDSIRNRSVQDLDVIYREMREVLWHNWENLVKNICVSGRVKTRFTLDEDTVNATSFAPDHDESDMSEFTHSRTGIVQEYE